MGLRYLRAPSGPNCYESPDVRVIDDQRDIPFTGTLAAVLAPTEATDADCECRLVGMIFDGQGTLIVDCLHSQDEIDAFRITCRANMIGAVTELPTPIARPCPPPRNQAQVADWSGKLFLSYRPPA